MAVQSRACISLRLVNMPASLRCSISFIRGCCHVPVGGVGAAGRGVLGDVIVVDICDSFLLVFTRQTGLADVFTFNRAVYCDRNGDVPLVKPQLRFKAATGIALYVSRSLFPYLTFIQLPLLLRTEVEMRLFGAVTTRSVHRAEKRRMGKGVVAGCAAAGRARLTRDWIHHRAVA